MINIKNRIISKLSPPYFIAEASCNHCGSLETAKDLIKAAKAAGADAIKFQCYEPEDMTIRCERPDFYIKDGPWAGRSLWDLYKAAHTPYGWFSELFSVANDIDITIFASVFSKRGVDLLESLRCPAYKIASMEIGDTNLIGYAAQTGKPIIISTGMASSLEIIGAQYAASLGGGRNMLLHCVSGYPTPVEQANLRRLKSLSRQYGDVGLSDHSNGDVVAIAAVANGACIVEKHLCMTRNSQSEDALFSSVPGEFHRMVTNCMDAYSAVNAIDTGWSQESSRQLKRSLYAVEDIPAGHQFTESNVRSIRPYYGAEPRCLHEFIGKKAKHFIHRGTPLTFDLLGY